MQLITYLNFDGNCKEAMTFYAKCLDGELTTMPFKDMPGGWKDESSKERLMHSRVTKGSTTLMASDTMPGHPFTPGNNFMVNIQCDSVEEAERLWGSLSDGGSVTMPLQETFWAERFGMLKDKFGVGWMLNMERAGQK